MGAIVKNKFHIRKSCNHVLYGTFGMYELVDTNSDIVFRIFVMTRETRAGAPFLSIQKEL